MRSVESAVAKRTVTVSPDRAAWYGVPGIIESSSTDGTARSLVSATTCAERLSFRKVSGMTTTTTIQSPYIINKHDSSVLDLSVYTSLDYLGDGTDKGDLFVRFTSGRTYFYPVVPAGVVLGLMLAKSAGQYFNAKIRDLHNWEVTDNTSLCDAITDLVKVMVTA
jgi:hypothetical protein